MNPRPGRINTLLDLVRIPNVVTAAADPLAGLLVAGSTSLDRASLVTLSAMLLYAGGVTLNDVADARRDMKTRPGRPIPSGRIRPRHAMLLALVLLVAGVFPAAQCGAHAGIVAAIVIGAIILYDVVLKTTSLAPFSMGLCRAASFLLGYAAGIDGGAWNHHVVWPVLIVWSYVTALTIFARREEVGQSIGSLIAGLAGVMLSIVAVPIVGITIGEGTGAYLVALGLLLLACFRYGIRAVQNPIPQQIQTAVKVFVLGLIVLEAGIAAAFAGSWPALAIMFLLVPAVSLAKLFRVT